MGPGRWPTGEAMANKTYRFRGGERRSTNPLVVRFSAQTSTRVKLDGVDKGPYSASTAVRIGVDATAGAFSGAGLPKLSFSYGANYTEVTFSGHATWSVSGQYLEVVSDGTLTVNAGAGALPVTQTDLQAASTLEFGSAMSGVDAGGPHKP